jgi:hypothetical protein
MREYEIVDTNAENIGACRLCGNKAGENEGHRRKSDWLKKRYAEGLRYKVLRSREFGDIVKGLMRLHYFVDPSSGAPIKLKSRRDERTLQAGSHPGR